MTKFTLSAVRALALWWISRPWVQQCRWSLEHSSKNMGRQWLLYQSEMAVFLSMRGMVATGPDLEKKHATTCFASLFDHLTFRGCTKQKASKIAITLLKKRESVTGFNILSKHCNMSIKLISKWDLQYNSVYKYNMRNPTTGLKGSTP